MLPVMDTLSASKQTTEAAPSRGWRNWYRSLADQETKYGFKRAGEVFGAAKVYLSKYLAETDALERWWFLEIAYEREGEIPFEYLGARKDPDS